MARQRPNGLNGPAADSDLVDRLISLRATCGYGSTVAEVDAAIGDTATRLPGSIA